MVKNKYLFSFIHSRVQAYKENKLNVDVAVVHSEYIEKTEFATFENVCYLTENGAADFDLLLIRGISTGALHILCGIFIGFGLAYIFRQRAIAITGMVGLLGACGVFHAIFNLLISADGIWRWMGYLFPSGMIIVLVSVWQS